MLRLGFPSWTRRNHGASASESAPVGQGHRAAAQHGADGEGRTGLGDGRDGQDLVEQHPFVVAADPRPGLPVRRVRHRRRQALRPASTLFISPKVVEKHVANIFDKLGLAPSDSDNRRVIAAIRYLES